MKGLAVILAATLFAAPAAAQEADPPMPPHIELPAELDRVLRDYEAAWRAEDEAALAALFTTDGFILRPGHPPVRGRDNIRESYASAGGPLFLSAFAFAAEDSIAYIVGGYSGTEEGPDSGKYVLTLRKERGKWMIFSDMDNGNRR